MRTTTINPVTLEGNLQPLAQNVMGIHAEALAAVTDSLINLYTNKNLAVVREYSTNARDAHISAGKDDVPIRVTLPNALSPKLVVEDEGIGMSQEQLLTFYSQYGASDKRDTDTMIGAFGFGCKAAFAISPQFSVDAVKDGMLTGALFSRDEKGVGRAQILFHVPTKAPDGVKVQVPTDDYQGLSQTAREFFSFWKPGTVLIDGREPSSLFSDNDLKVGNVVLVQSIDRRLMPGSNKFVVMGNVAYPMSGHTRNAWDNIVYDRNQQTKTFVYAEIGDVDIVPSREGLRDNGKTLDWIKKQAKQFSKAYVEVIQAEINQEKTFIGALRKLSHYSKVAPVKITSSPWHGKYILISQCYTEARGTMINDDGYKKLATREDQSFHVSEPNLNILRIRLSTDDPEEIDLAVKKIRRGSRPVLSEYKSVLVVPKSTRQMVDSWLQYDIPGFDKEMTMDEYAEYRLAVAKKLKASNPSGPREKTVVDYRIYANKNANGQPGFASTLVADIKKYKTVYYGKQRNNASSYPVSERFLEGSMREILQIRPLADDECVISLGPQQKEETMLRRFPGAIHFSKYAIKALDDVYDEKITDEFVYDLVQYTTYNDHRFRECMTTASLLHPFADDIEDPELKAYVKKMGRNRTELSQVFKDWGKLLRLPYVDGNLKFQGMSRTINSYSNDLSNFRKVHHQIIVYPVLLGLRSAILNSEEILREVSQKAITTQFIEYANDKYQKRTQ